MKTMAMILALAIVAPAALVSCDRSPDVTVEREKTTTSGDGTVRTEKKTTTTDTPAGTVTEKKTVETH